MTESLMRLLISTGSAVALTLVIGWAVDRALQRVGARHPRSALWPLLRRVRMPLQLTVCVALVLAATPTSGLSRTHRELLQHGLLLVLIACSGWLAARVIAAAVEPSVTRYAAVSTDYARVRRVRTQVTLIRRVLTVTVTVIAIAVMLMTFPQARAAGTSVLASAGVLGIVVGIAAQSTLGNVFAGLQIAFGDTVRIGDVVVFEGEWGTVEEITLTYVVLLTWDERRIVMPVSHFTGNPFENWSRRDTRMTGTVFFHLDHSAPIAELREHLRKVVESSPYWDKRDWSLLVTDTTPTSIQVRALVTASDADTVWNLRCEVRENLIAFLREHHPYALPRLVTAPAPAAAPVTVHAEVERPEPKPQPGREKWAHRHSLTKGGR